MFRSIPILLMILLCQCYITGEPPPDYKECNKIRPFDILILNEPNGTLEKRQEDINILILIKLRCRKRYDDYKKTSPFE